MAEVPLVSANLKEAIDNRIAAGDVADAQYAKIYSGTGAATTIQMSKKGDIYVKTDTPHVYIAKSTTAASGWIQVD